MITLQHLEQATDWLTAANLGNSTPGAGATANYGVTPGAIFYISSPGPYGNGYLYRVLPVDAAVVAARNFHYEFSFSLPVVGIEQALECEFQRQIARADGSGADVYNWALQLDLAGGTFRHFDYAKKAWISTGIKIPPLVAGAIYKVALDGRLLLNQDTGRLMTMVDSFGFAGATCPTSMLFEQTFLAGATEKFTHAFQMDTTGQTPPPPYQVVVRDMSISYQ